MCSSKKICAVLMGELCDSKDHYLVVQRRKNVNSSKNGKFKYKMIGKTRPEIELLEVITLIYPFSLKAGSSIPSATRI